MSEEEHRVPVCASGSRTDMIVLCRDGSAWQLGVNSSGATWSELPPIPGSYRDKEASPRYPLQGSVIRYDNPTDEL